MQLAETMKPSLDNRLTAPRSRAGAKLATITQSGRPGLALCTAAMLLVAQPGSSRAGIANGQLPDGPYHCEAYLLGLFLDLGTITIKGNVYSGPTYGGRVAQGYNYQIDPNGEVAWLGPLGGFTSGGNSVSLTQVTADDEKDAAFDIIMRQADGAFTAATCTLQPITL